MNQNDPNDTGAMPYRLTLPPDCSANWLMTSPHSGASYPDAFIAASRLSENDLRMSEDAYVDQLLTDLPALGAAVLSATYPRAYLDLNREAFELDPVMFDTPLPGHCNTKSQRVLSGLGTIARIVAEGKEIYQSKLTYAEAEQRIERIYKPFHARIADFLTTARQTSGTAFLLDVHSMPSSAVRGFSSPANPVGADFVLGNRHGRACDDSLLSRAEDYLTAQGFRVLRNKPYAGGYITEHYGNPRKGIHALQIEINRQLYMNEKTMRPFSGLGDIRRHITGLVTHLMIGEELTLDGEMPKAAE